MGELRHRTIRMTKGQARYLQELIQFDLEDTPLTDDEEQQARILLGRVEHALDKWEDRVSADS